MKIADMHCDTLSLILEEREAGREMFLRENKKHIDLLRMKKSGYLVQNFAMFVNYGAERDPWENVCALYEIYKKELEANKDFILPALSYEDILKNEREGKMSSVLTVEEGGVCKGEIEKLYLLYNMGVRMMTLTWNYPNELAYPNINGKNGKKIWKLCDTLKEMKKQITDVEGEKKHYLQKEYCEKQKEAQQLFENYFFTPNITEGLTETGKKFVYEMEKLGIIIDVSHLSDAGFYDVLKYTKKPFVASHSNARSVCRCTRNMTNDMIKKLAERGGCMGLNFCADFLAEAPFGTQNNGKIADVVRHAQYIVNIGGIEVLGLGSDFDGIDTHKELTGSESMEKLWHALHKAGFTEAQLDLIFYKNVLRIYKEVC